MVSVPLLKIDEPMADEAVALGSASAWSPPPIPR